MRQRGKLADTRRKTKVIGRQEYINPQTGEIQDFQVIRVEDRDFNFHKIWLQHVIQSLELIGNQKTKLAFWLISEMDTENKICYTLRQMAEKSGISLETVRVTVQALIKSDFLIRQNMGVYKIHPDKVFKGTNGNRMNVLLQYEKVQQEERKKRIKAEEVEKIAVVQ